MSNTTKGNIAAAVGYCIFGIGITFTKICLRYTTPFIMMAIRILISFLCLNLILCFGKFKLNLKGKPVGKLLLMGLAQPIGNFVFQNLGMQRTSSSFTGVIMGLSPVMGLLLAALFLKEKCSALQWTCAAVSVVGVVLTTTGVLGGVDMLGLIFLLIGMIANALFSTVSRSLASDITPFERTYVMFGEGTVLFVILALFELKGNFSLLVTPLTSPPFWIGVLFGGIINSVIAFFLLNYSLSYLPSGRSVLYCNLATVVAVLAGIFFMHESFTWMQIVGVIIIVICVFGVVWRKKVPAKV